MNTIKRPKPVNNEIYHIFNIGVDKRDIFMDEKDYLRFIHDLWEFNDWAPAANIFYRKKSTESYEVGLRKDFRGKKGELVEILAFALMPNHFHLMLRQSLEEGVTEFMRKLGTGYTNYFNKKHKRTGSLFQGIYKIAHLANRSQFLYLPYYIHANPLELKFPSWKKNKIKNTDEAISFLNSYKWSSHPDYIGQKNFPSLIKKNFLMKIFNNEKKYQTDFEDWLKDFNVQENTGLVLE